MISKEALLKKLNIESTNEIFEKIYEHTLQEFSERGAFFMNMEFLEEIQEKYTPFHIYYDYVKERLARLVGNDELCFFSLLLHRMLEYNREMKGANISMFPRKPLDSVEDEVDFEFAGFIAQLAFAHEMADFYIKRGFPVEHFSETLTDMFETAGIYAYSLSAGRLGYNNTTYFNWNQYYIYHKIVRIGQLNFEIDRPFHEYCIALRNKSGECKILAYNKGVAKGGVIVGTLGDEVEEFFAEFNETDDAYIGYEIDTVRALVTKNKLTLPKNEWSVAIRPGDNFLNVHIPRSGKINKENNEYAYREAIRLHRIMYPDKDLKAIGCCSWLLSPTLTEILPETSNIVAFLNPYHKYPIKTQGKAVFSFLYPKKAEKYEDLEESTSLQRKVKELYLNGGAVLEAAGLIFPDEL